MTRYVTVAAIVLCSRHYMMPIVRIQQNVDCTGSHANFSTLPGFTTRLKSEYPFYHWRDSLVRLVQSYNWLRFKHLNV